MKKTTLISSFIGSLLISSIAFADSTGHKSKITKIYPIANGSVMLYFDDSHAECTNTAGTPLNRFYLTVNRGESPVTELGFKNIYSAALTAFSSDRSVWIRFDTTGSACSIDRIVVYRD